MNRFFLRWLISLVAVFCLGGTLLPRLAAADSTLDGKWKQGPLKEDYTIQKWLNACGPAPLSGSTGGGEVVSIHVEGDELAFVGGGRVYRSNQCYDQMPTLVRDAHSRDPSGKSWRTRCTTPPSDPRHALMQTLVTAASDTHIDVVETGRYEIAIADGHCVADVKRSRSFDLIASDAVAAPASAAPAPVSAPGPAPTPPPSGVDPARCASPGDPVRLEVRPARKLVRAGDTFQFRAIVADANGCATRTPTSWVLAASSTGGDAPKLSSVDASGKVVVPIDAPEGPFEIVATAAGKSARVTVEVASPSSYDELLAESGLNDAGESEAASVTLIATGSIGGGNAKAEDGSHRRRLAFLAIVGTLTLGLGIVAIIGIRRGRRATALARAAEERHQERLSEIEKRRKEREDEHAAAVRAHEESVAKAAQAAGMASKMICPSCRREYGAGSVFCPSDANRLVPTAGRDDLRGAPLGGICPTCKRGFDPGIRVCSHDGEELVPYALYASRNSGGDAPKRGRICPTCGDRFEGNAAFCGKDGTALVLLN